MASTPLPVDAPIAPALPGSRLLMDAFLSLLLFSSPRFAAAALEAAAL
jgi:hypothetical protein